MFCQMDNNFNGLVLQLNMAVTVMYGQYKLQFKSFVQRDGHFNKNICFDVGSVVVYYVNLNKQCVWYKQYHTVKEE